MVNETKTGIATSEKGSALQRISPMVSATAPGTRVTLKVLRDGKTREKAATLAGLKPGEVIQKIDRQPLDSVRAALEAVRAAGKGSLLLRVYGNGGSRYVALRLER